MDKLCLIFISVYPIIMFIYVYKLRHAPQSWIIWLNQVFNVMSSEKWISLCAFIQSNIVWVEGTCAIYILCSGIQGRKWIWVAETSFFTISCCYSCFPRSFPRPWTHFLKVRLLIKFIYTVLQCCLRSLAFMQIFHKSIFLGVICFTGRSYIFHLTEFFFKYKLISIISR